VLANVQAPSYKSSNVNTLTGIQYTAVIHGPDFLLLSTNMRHFVAGLLTILSYSIANTNTRSEKLVAIIMLILIYKGIAILNTNTICSIIWCHQPSVL